MELRWTDLRETWKGTLCTTLMKEASSSTEESAFRSDPDNVQPASTTTACNWLHLFKAKKNVVMITKRCRHGLLITWWLTGNKHCPNKKLLSETKCPLVLQGLTFQDVLGTCNMI